MSDKRDYGNSPADDFYKRSNGGLIPFAADNSQYYGSLDRIFDDLKFTVSHSLSVPAVFADDVEDGDVVMYDVISPYSANTSKGAISSGQWEKAHKRVEGKDAFSDFQAHIYGVAYRRIERVLFGPVIVHPKYQWPIGTKLFADYNGAITTAATDHPFAVQISPYQILLLQPSAYVKEALKWLVGSSGGDLISKYIDNGSAVVLNSANKIALSFPQMTPAERLELLSEILCLNSVLKIDTTNNSNCLTVDFSQLTDSDRCIIFDGIAGTGGVITLSQTQGKCQLQFDLSKILCTNGIITKTSSNPPCLTIDFTKMTKSDRGDLLTQIIPSSGTWITINSDNRISYDFNNFTDADRASLLSNLIDTSAASSLAIDSTNQNRLIAIIPAAPPPVTPTTPVPDYICADSLVQLSTPANPADTPCLIIDFNKLTNDGRNALLTNVLSTSATSPFIIDNSDANRLGFDLSKLLCANKMLTLTTTNPKCLYIDFNKMSNDERQDLTNQIVLAGGGIERTTEGRMYVSIDAPAYLNSDIEVAVNKGSSSATDSLDPSIDRTSPSRVPFKTINGAVLYVTKSYNVGERTVTIIVANGNYYEEVHLTAFQAHTGKIVIRGSGTQAFIYGTTGSGVLCTGGNWEIHNMHLHINAPKFNDNGNHTLSAVWVTKGATLTLMGNHCMMSVTADTGSYRDVALLRVSDRGALYLMPSPSSYGVSRGFEMTNGTYASYSTVFRVENRGTIYFETTKGTATNNDYAYNGAVTVNAYVDTYGMITKIGDNTLPVTLSLYSGKTFNAQRFYVGSHSLINVGSPTFFLGSVAGVVDTAAYGLYI